MKYLCNYSARNAFIYKITGYLSATEGQAIIDGYDILENPTEAKKKIGYLPEQPPLYIDMTVDEYLYMRRKNDGMTLT